MLCLNCNKEISNRNKYCSIKCQKEYEYKNYILRWKKRRREWPPKARWRSCESFRESAYAEHPFCMLGKNRAFAFSFSAEENGYSAFCFVKNVKRALP